MTTNVLVQLSKARSALAALSLLAIVSACGPSARHLGAGTAAAAAPPPPGVTDRMPSDEGVASEVVDESVISNRARAVVTARDRAQDDRALDTERRPAELLTFLGVDSGWRVGLLVAGSGYTAELLARAVAPSGTVYAENPSFVLAGAETAWSTRLASPAMKTVVRVDRELADPLPPEARDLDLVVINLVYHDAVGLGLDRERMNRAVFDALRSGGKYVVIDHSARPGAGLVEVHTLHRIDQEAVRSEVERVGFRLAREGNFLRNPADTRDWRDSPEATQERGDTSDRFAMMFVKP
jgi:predicted methyltransferase